MKKMTMMIVLAVAAAAALAVTNLSLVQASSASASESKEAKVTLRVDGMHCASCPITVRVTLARLDGVKEAVVSRKDKRASVTYDPSRVTPSQMVKAVNESGYKARVASEQEG